MGIGAILGNTKLGQYIVKDTVKSLAYSSFTPSSTLITNGSPVWRNLSELTYLLDCYYENPVVQAVINIKAKAFSNMKFSVKDLKNGEIIPLKEYTADKGKLNALISKPNPLQSTFEWLRQYKVNHEVFGNGYCYASIPIGFEKNFNYHDINVINNLPPYAMSPVLTGKWLEAEERDEIIERYVLSYFNGKTKDLNPNAVFHTNNENIRVDQKFTEGVSELIALKMPISNIRYAYESRNVLIRKRGAIGAWTSEKKDEAMGNLPLNDGEIKKVQDAFKNYGLLEDQYQQIISPQPLKWQKTAMNVKDLMLFEEIEADAIAVANAKGVPEDLLRYYIRTGGLGKENNVSEKRLYDSTIIPESEDFMNGLNNFLKTEESGIELIGSFSHLNALQVDKKKEADTNKTKSATAKGHFMSGLTTFGQYAIDCGVELMDASLENKRVWDLEERQLQAIGVTINTVQNGENK